MSLDRNNLVEVTEKEYGRFTDKIYGEFANMINEANNIITVSGSKLQPLRLVCYDYKLHPLMAAINDRFSVVIVIRYKNTHRDEPAYKYYCGGTLEHNSLNIGTYKKAENLVEAMEKIALQEEQRREKMTKLIWVRQEVAEELKGVDGVKDALITVSCVTLLTKYARLYIVPVVSETRETFSLNLEVPKIPNRADVRNIVEGIVKLLEEKLGG